ncbi:MAG: hypothetical protein HC892_12865, partial [Saprospiraceae bacterium]|nr:hypothetical protein [Saprospiraceae bacterium]
NGANTQSINVSQAGNVVVTVTNANGCTDIEQVAVQQFEAAVAVITGEEAICQDEQTTLTASGGSTFLWNNSETTPSITVGAGTYSVVVTNANGCSATTTKIVVENELPTFAFTSNATCNAQLNGYSLTISTSDGNSVSASEGTVSPNGNGSFSILDVPSGKNVTITVTSASGCRVSTIVNAPDCACPSLAAPVSGGNLQICEGDELPRLTVQNDDENLLIDWYNAPTGGSLLASASNAFTPNAPGTYYAEARDAVSGCQSSVRTAITLTANVRPKVEVVAVEILLVQTM